MLMVFNNVVERGDVNRFPMASLRKSLGLPGNDLVQRANGQRARALMEEQIHRIAPGQVLVLDFDGVGLMDASFADAALVSLAVDLAAGAYGDRFLVLTGVDADTLDNIAAASERRKARLIVGEGKQSEIVGRLEPNLVVAWQLARELGTVTARMLADRLHLEINTASMRLRKLYDARLLARTEEVSTAGRQHLYYVPA